MSQASRPIRSYQSVFAPERRLYQVEGRSLPVPGGVPLRWLAWAAGSLAAVLALSSGSGAVLLGAAVAGAGAGLAWGGREAAALAAVAALAAAWVGGVFLGVLEWPLRLVVLPVGIATLATQTTPDGRRAERFAASWLALRLAPARRTLGRALPLSGRPLRLGAELRVAPDSGSPRLRRARLRGPATVRFARPVELGRDPLRRGRLVIRPALDEGAGRRFVELAPGEVAEVRG